MSKKQKKSNKNKKHDVGNDKNQSICQMSDNQGVKSVDSETDFEGTSEGDLNNIESDNMDKEIEPSLESNNNSDEGGVPVEKETSVEEKVQTLSFLEKIGCMFAKKYVGSLKQQIEDIKNECTEKQLQLEDYGKNLQGFRNEITTKDAKINNLGEERDALKTEKQELESNNTELNNKIKVLKGEIEKYECALKDSNQQLKKLKNKNNEILKEMNGKFKDIEEMTIDEAITELWNAFGEYKKQVGLTKKGADDAKRESEELKEKLQEAEKRVNDIESSDNGKLIQDLESIRHDLKEKESLLAQKTDEFEYFKKNDYARLEKEKKEHEESINRLNEEIEKLKKGYETSITELENKHKKELGTKDNEHKNEVNRIEQSSAKKEKELKDKYSEEINAIKKEASNKENKLNSELQTKENEIAGLKTMLQDESESLKNRTIDVITRLHEFLKSNEIMAACSDDYREVVEEKLQNLIFNSQEMINEVRELPEVKKPSEWEATLKSYILKKIEEKTSLINILLKYYTLSSVPFMIDAERDNGLYFVRKNIKEAHNAIVTILRQCNITPILPSLFVENINEGIYEVGGEFNDIESFCPGSINEHIKYIERSKEGLNNIIIGVTRVGYSIDNSKIIKAKVLIS